MRVLLLSMNTETEPFPVLPIGLSCVAASLRNAGHEVKVLDLLFSGGFRGEIVKTVASFSPGMIGLSIRNIDNCTCSDPQFYLPYIKEVVEACSGQGARLVAGGSGFSIMPEAVLSYLNMDLGIVGEGERALPALLERLENGREFEDIPGVIHLDGNSVRKTPPVPIREIDRLPVPAMDLLDHEQYIQECSMAGVQTKRGCGFRCIYCTYPLIEGRSV